GNLQLVAVGILLNFNWLCVFGWRYLFPYFSGGRRRDAEQLFVAGGEISILLEIPDDHLASLSHRGTQMHGVQLPGKVIGQRGRTREKIFERRLFDRLPLLAAAITGVEIFLKEAVHIDL